MTTMARVNVYESDQLQTYVRLADEYDDFYELPAHLLTDFQRAEAELDRARDAIAAYIRDHGVTKVTPWDDTPPATTREEAR